MAIVGTQSWQCIAYGNGKYIAMGWQSASSTSTCFITRSTDGVTWTTPENMDRVDRLIFANARFVGWSGGLMSVSTDGGYTWTRFSTPSVPSGYGSFSLSDIAYGNGRFIAVSKSSGYTAISMDGVNWSTPNRNGTNSLPLYSIIYGNDQFVAVSSKNVCISSDGESWTTTPVACFEQSNCQWTASAFGNGTYVVVGSSGMIGYCSSSTDGVNWSVPVQTRNVNWYDVTYMNGFFVACGSEGYISYSTDGVTWSVKRQLKDETGKTISSSLRGIIGMP